MGIALATASQLAQMIRDKKITSEEVIDIYLQQIERHNDKINAVVTQDRARAIRKAQEADRALARGENWGIFHGVPITIKDLIQTAGLTTTAGYLPLKNYIPDNDALVVARLKASGAIVLGKTNTPKFGEDYQTYNQIFGRTNNPWGLDKTVGGSSGGSGAAVAGGFTPLDIGSDIGGSIRLPAHYCGVYGLMPTDGRVSTRGHIPPLPGKQPYIRHMLRIGPLARSVEDLRLCLTAIAGIDSNQPDIPPVPLDLPNRKQLSELKIAWTYGYDFLPISRDTRSSLKNAIARFTDAGIQLTESHPNAEDWSEILSDYGTLCFFELFASLPGIKSLFEGIRTSLRAEFLTRTKTSFNSGSPFTRKSNAAFPPTLAKYKAVLGQRDRATDRMDSFMASWDAWLCPVSLTSAFSHRDFGQPIEVDGIKFPYLLACGGYTMPLNFTGHPVVVIPMSKTKSGLPLGLQIVGKRWQEMNLLAIAQQLDSVMDNQVTSPF